MVARGTSLSRSKSAASSSSRRSPLVATMTGSSTTRVPGNASSPVATASIMSLVASIPILMAPTSRSLATARIWANTNSGGTGMTPSTPRVFCAVSAVIALAPYTPSAENVLMSAWIPAPPDESEPAMVSATAVFSVLMANHYGQQIAKGKRAIFGQVYIWASAAARDATRADVSRSWQERERFAGSKMRSMSSSWSGRECRSRRGARP